LTGGTYGGEIDTRPPHGALGAGQGILAGSWRRKFAVRGVTLSQADCLIAAASVGIEARLATGTPEDYPMAGLEVEHWPVGV
jgi:predicted nucleic acid-binding protein